MNTVLSPLLRRTFLLPGESLPSLLIRLARLNTYEPLGIINGLILSGTRENKRKNRAGRPSLAETYTRIELLTRIPSPKLHTATVHRFAPIVTPPGQDIASLTLPSGVSVPLLLQDAPEKSRTHPRLRTLRGDKAGQFCPQCLQEHAYHRLLWSLVAVSACFRHKCLLASACHVCGRPVSIQSIVIHTCMECHADLRETPTLLLIEDIFGLFAQQSIQAWLMDIATPASGLYAVAERPPNVLYQFVHGLQLAAANLAVAGSSYIHSPDGRSLDLSKTQNGISLTSTPYQSYCLYATTFKGIVNWPAGFYEFLDAHRSLNNYEGNNWSISQMGKLSVIWYDQDWQHPSLSFLQEALVRYNFKTSMPTASNLKLDGFVAQLEEFTGVTTVLRAARLLQTSHILIKRLLEIGHLKPYESKERFSALSTPIWLAEVLELYRVWREAITLEEVVQWLGITRNIVADMVKVGLLTIENETGSSCANEGQWMFQRESVSDCLLRIVRYVLVTDIPSDTIDLTAAGMHRSGEINAARVLKYLADGRLRAYFPEETYTLNSLRFKPADIEVRANEDQAERELVSSEEVAMRMDMRGMKAWRAVISRWVDAGLLTPVASCEAEQCFDRREVDVFVSRYVISKNIPRMFLLTPDQITRLMRNGKLLPLSGLEVDRSPVNLFELQDLKNAVSVRMSKI